MLYTLRILGRIQLFTGRFIAKLKFLFLAAYLYSDSVGEASVA